jgi:hypothetical protein
VLADETSIPPRWTITIIPEQPKVKTVALRAAPRMRPFAEDYC